MRLYLAAAVGCLLQADNSCAQANQAQAAGLPSHSRVSRVPPATDSFLSYIPVHSSKAYMSAPRARGRALDVTEVEVAFAGRWRCFHLAVQRGLSLQVGRAYF